MLTKSDYHPFGSFFKHWKSIKQLNQQSHSNQEYHLNIPYNIDASDSPEKIIEGCDYRQCKGYKKFRADIGDEESKYGKPIKFIELIFRDIENNEAC